MDKYTIVFQKELEFICKETAIEYLMAHDFYVDTKASSTEENVLIFTNRISTATVVKSEEKGSLTFSNIKFKKRIKHITNLRDSNNKELDDLRAKRSICDMIKKEELKIQNKLYNDELRFLTSLLGVNNIL